MHWVAALVCALSSGSTTALLPGGMQCYTPDAPTSLFISPSESSMLLMVVLTLAACSSTTNSKPSWLISLTMPSGTVIPAILWCDKIRVRGSDLRPP
jgi:hypothetical protein